MISALVLSIKCRWLQRMLHWPNRQKPENANEGTPKKYEWKYHKAYCTHKINFNGIWSHPFDYDNTTIISKCANIKKSLIIEAPEILKHKNSVNLRYEKSTVYTTFTTNCWEIGNYMIMYRLNSHLLRVLIIDVYQ